MSDNGIDVVLDRKSVRPVSPLSDQRFYQLVEHLGAIESNELVDCCDPDNEKYCVDVDDA